MSHLYYCLRLFPSINYSDENHCFFIKIIIDITDIAALSKETVSNKILLLNKTFLFDSLKYSLIKSDKFCEIQNFFLSKSIKIKLTS